MHYCITCGWIANADLMRLREGVMEVGVAFGDMDFV